MNRIFAKELDSMIPQKDLDSKKRVIALVNDYVSNGVPEDVFNGIEFQTIMATLGQVEEKLEETSEVSRVEMGMAAAIALLLQK